MGAPCHAARRLPPLEDAAFQHHRRRWRSHRLDPQAPRLITRKSADTSWGSAVSLVSIVHPRGVLRWVCGCVRILQVSRAVTSVSRAVDEQIELVIAEESMDMALWKQGHKSPLAYGDQDELKKDRNRARSMLISMLRRNLYDGSWKIEEVASLMKRMRVWS